MKLGPLLLIILGSTILGIGAVLSGVGGAGELAYYQCVANSGSQCTSAGNNQYITVFIANSDLLGIGMNLLSMGVIILLAGIIANYITTPSPATAGLNPSSQIVTQTQQVPTLNRTCPKCGSQVAPTSKFCGFCGTSLA